MTNDLSQILALATKSATAGGAVLKDCWGHIDSIETKTDFCDLVTNVDKASEDTMLSFIKTYYPNHTILSEESGLSESQNSDHFWIIDPLDGTTNYIHQYPMICTTIAYVYKNELLVGVTFDPLRDELFHAIKGGGAYLNDKKIHVSSTKKLSSSLLATGFAYDRQREDDTNYKEFCHLTHITHGVRRGGSAALDLAYVATGRLDGFWEHGLKPWDIAAGSLLIKEALGSVTDYDEKPFDLYKGSIIGSNGQIHSSLSQEIMHVKQSP